MSETLPQTSDLEFSGKQLVSELEAVKAPQEQPPTVEQQKEEILGQIKDARARGDRKAEQALVEKNRELHQTPGEVPSDIDESKQESARQQQLKEIVSSIDGQETDEELLKKFGLVNEDSVADIHSPLLRANTQQAFERYITAVRQFDAASRIESELGIRVRSIDSINQKRVGMHDAVANLISDDLGLDFAASRRLAAKIRDGQIPGSGESRMYARRIQKELDKYNYDMNLWANDKAADFQKGLETPQ